VNLVRDTDPTAGITWAREEAVGRQVVSAKSFVNGTNVVADTMSKAGNGDANLDGTVDVQDLLKLGQNYNTTGKTWFEGDFNYDGAVDVQDLLLLGQNYNTPVPADGVPSSSSAFAADVAMVFSQVPEPGTFGAVGLGLATGLLRRRRK
jgi:hypothetical protein